MVKIGDILIDKTRNNWIMFILEKKNDIFDKPYFKIYFSNYSFNWNIDFYGIDYENDWIII